MVAGTRRGTVSASAEITRMPIRPTAAAAVAAIPTASRCRLADCVSPGDVDVDAVLLEVVMPSADRADLNGDLYLA